MKLLSFKSKKMKKLFMLVAFIATVFAQAGFSRSIADETHPSNLLIRYYHIKDALIEGNATPLASTAEEFVKEINSVDAKISNEASRSALLPDASHISESKDFKVRRTHFASMSDNMFALVPAGKLSSPVYQFYCPMKKSIWPSSEKSPYFGMQCLIVANSQRHADQSKGNIMLSMS
jgi:hypothetical protein